MEINYIDIAEYTHNASGAVLCTIVDSEGNTPRHAGAKMIVRKDGSTVGTVGGGNIELEAIDAALHKVNKPHLQKFQLLGDAGMICGGSVTIYFEPLCTRPYLYIFGGGHVGQAIVKFGNDMGFNIIIIDQRKEIAEYFAKTDIEVWEMDYTDAVNKIDYNYDTYIVITTPRHEYDETILAAIAKKPHKYIGLMASPEKVKAIKEKFIEKEILSKEELDNIDMPIGVPIKCETPADIAISVWAMIVDIKNS